MMREFFTKRLGLALAAGLGLATLASSAQAALITLDLRATSTGSVGSPVITGGGKTVSFASAGGTNQLSVDVYATVQNSDANPGNEGFQLLHTGYISTEGAGSAQGNMTALARNPLATVNGTSQNGTATNLDANADLEWGGADHQSTTGWNINAADTFGAMYSDGSVNPAFGTDNGDGTVSFRIARLTWKPTAAGTADLLQFLLRNFSTGTDIQQRTVVFYSDAPRKADDPNTPGVDESVDANGNPLYIPTALKPTDAQIVLGSPVSITVAPEPTSLGLLGLGAMGLLARRRRTA